MKGNRAKIERLQTKYSNAVRKMLWDELCTQRPAFPMFGKGFLICVYLMAHFQHLQELAENKVTDLFFLRYFLRDVIQEHRVIEWILLTYRDNPLYLIFGTIILGIICGFIRKATAKRNVPKLGEKIERLRREILSLGGSIPYITGVYWDETEGRYYYESHDTSKKTGGSGSTSGAGGSGSTSGAGDSGSAYSTGSSRAYKSDSTGNRTAYGEKTDSAGYTEAARKMFGIDPEGDDSEPDDRNTEWNTDDDDIPEGIRNWAGDWLDEENIKEYCDDPVFGPFGFKNYNRSDYESGVRHMLVEDYKPGEYEAEFVLLNVSCRFRDRFKDNLSYQEGLVDCFSPFDSECYFPIPSLSSYPWTGNTPYYFDRNDLPEEQRKDYDKLCAAYMEDDFRFFKGSPQSPREIMRARTHARLIHARMFSENGVFPNWKKGCRPDGTFDSTEGGIYPLVDSQTVTCAKRAIIRTIFPDWECHAIVWDAYSGFRFPTYEKFTESRPDYDWIEYLWHRRCALAKFINKTREELDAHFYKKKDPYYILQIKHGATQAEIKKAWKKRIQQFHPDNHQDEIEDDYPFMSSTYGELAKKGYEKACLDVNNAYKTLSEQAEQH